MPGDCIGVLLISNDVSGAKLIHEFLTESSEGTLTLETCCNSEEFGTKLNSTRWDTILLDQSLPEKRDFQFVANVLDTPCNTPIVVLSCCEDLDYAQKVRKLGAHDCVILGKDDGKSIVKTLKSAAKHQAIKTSLKHSTSLLTTVMEASVEAIILIGDDGKIARWNDGAQTLFGYYEAEILGQPAWKLVHHSKKSQINALILNAPQTHNTNLRSNMSSGVGLKKDGHAFPIELAFSQLNSDIGGNVIGIIRDITDKKSLWDIKRASEVVFDSITEGVMITDTKNKVTAVNQGFCEITGYQAEEIIGKTPAILNSGRHGKIFYIEMWQCLQTSGRWQGEVWNRRKDGEIYPEWLTIEEVRDEEGQINQYVAVFSDISKRHASEEANRLSANNDALTGLPNRILLYDRLKQAISQAQRSQTKVVIQVIDLDWFDWINDTLGASVGDKLLQNIGTRLALSISSEDTVARMGGDEFAIVLTQMAEEQDMVNTAKKTIATLDAPFTLNGEETYITGSIGIAVYPDDGQDPDVLLKNANIALKKAKGSGRNTFRFFQNQMNNRTHELAKLERALRQALTQNEISVHYQPQINLNTGKIIGAEALMRWNSRELGPIPPDVFIPIAEKCGMIRSLGTWILEASCRQQKIWRDKGFVDHHVAINVSAIQFQDDDFSRTVMQIIEDTGIKPQDIELELTESLLMDQSDDIRSKFREISDLGVSLSLDDFGTGFSSLSCLKQFPINTLKIDKSFIDGVANTPDDQAIIKAIIGMGQALGQKVVSEGVETSDQLEYLKSVNCDIVQGYYYSKPLPAAEFEDLL
ncbi:MAG: EAL domain-containing protein [Magnetovibrio sp.]|nr:EAL domain-containing protein [Magnetovibrio sp.]